MLISVDCIRKNTKTMESQRNSKGQNERFREQSPQQEVLKNNNGLVYLLSLEFVLLYTYMYMEKIRATLIMAILNITVPPQIKITNKRSK